MTPSQKETKLETLTAQFDAFHKYLVQELPESPDKYHALRTLNNASTEAHAAVRNFKEDEADEPLAEEGL